MKQCEPLIKLDHIPESHQKYMTCNDDVFMVWAMSVGSMVERVKASFLESDKAPEQGYKAFASLMKLGERYGKEHLETMCMYVLAYGTMPSIRNISSILKRKQYIKPNNSAIKKPFKNTNLYGITHGTAYLKNIGDHGCVTG